MANSLNVFLKCGEVWDIKYLNVVMDKTPDKEILQEKWFQKMFVLEDSLKGLNAKLLREQVKKAGICIYTN